jgi:hypothetical protein
VLEAFLALLLRPAGANLGRRHPYLLRRRHEHLDVRSLPEAQHRRSPLDGLDVELADLARLAVTLPLKRRKRQVFGDLVETQVAIP